MKSKSYAFPITRPHSGIPISNGIQGLLIWGNNHVLNITIGRAGFWDHRGGTPFTTSVQFSGLRTMLESGRETELGALFATAAGKKSYARPCQLGTGRLEILLPPSWVLEDGTLSLESGHAVVHASGPDGARGRIEVLQSRSTESAWLVFENVRPLSVKARPVWEWEQARLALDGVPAPETWQDDNEGGFLQRLPDDPGVALGWKLVDETLHLTTALIAGEVDAARATLWKNHPPLAADRTASTRWWREFSTSLPTIRLPDSELQEIWELHSYKLAGAHPPGAPAGSLQSAWMEDHRLPPWSNDYHFNINLQMMYWPCLGANRLEHFTPLWEMITSWFPALKANGAAFFNDPEAMMLPHAVDDRCQVVGSFWSGTIDHACTAWVAQMAWLHYRHSMDETILRDIAWPLLHGAFAGFWAMTIKTGDGSLALPVSVSPEYHAYTPNGVKLWGSNASFQLAAFHMLAQILPDAAAVLGKAVDPRWQEVREKLPRFSALPGRSHRWGQQQHDVMRIGLWDGQDLDESHRHHSHLAGIFPFQTLDPRDNSTQSALRESLAHWQALGAGKWAGWSFPWASILCARCDLGDAAVAWLKWWANVFTDPHGATLHDADFPGCGALHAGTLLGPQESREIETMQLDAGCGVVQAILELMVQQRGKCLHILPSLPARWRDLSFDGIRVEGAFLVGATVSKRVVTEIRVHSERGGDFHFSVGESTISKHVQMEAGESLSLSREQFADWL